MDIMTNGTRNPLLFGGLLFFIFVILSRIIFFGSTTNADADMPVTQITAPAYYLSTSTVPLAVSGVVQAANQAIIYAETAGVVTTLYAREGAVVQAGSVLVEQSLPVLAAEQEALNAERLLSGLQQSQTVAVSELYTEQAKARIYSAEEIAALRVAANDSRVTESVAQLRVVIDSNILTLIEVVHYVQRNRTLFSADGMRTYEKVVTDLYGQIPNYFRGAVMRPKTTSEDILAAIADLKNNDAVTLTELTVLAELMEKQFAAVAYLFTTGENDVFSRESESSTREVWEEFNAKRASIVSGEQQIRSAIAQATTVFDAMLEDVVTQNATVEVTALDVLVAETQATFAHSIASQVDAVALAAQRVVLAQQSLGRPTAPFAGTVSRVHINAGEYVSPGTALLTLVGVDARELTVFVPAYVLKDVAVGQAFVVDGVTKGYVNRFSTASYGGGAEVVIALVETEASTIGTSMTGQLFIESTAAVYQVERRYVHFDATGPYIVYRDNVRSAITILYDGGQVLFIEVADVRGEALVPAVSIRI